MSNAFDRIERLIAANLPSPLKEEWEAINREIAAIELKGEKRTDHADLMERMDTVMMSDEFVQANSAANNQVMAEDVGLDIDWWMRTAPKPGG